MAQDFSWHVSARLYSQLYAWAVDRRRSVL
jgi:hypothetical protein